jgi:hypothetical protein
LIADRLKNVAKVPLPAKIRLEKDAVKRIGGTNANSLDRKTTQNDQLGGDPMKDESYVRRLKMANYGKWYLQP